MKPDCLKNSQERNQARIRGLEGLQDYMITGD